MKYPLNNCQLQIYDLMRKTITSLQVSLYTPIKKFKKIEAVFLKCRGLYEQIWQFDWQSICQNSVKIK